MMTSDPHRALAWVENDKSVAVLVVDQAVRGLQAVNVLEAAKQIRAEVRRIIITNYEHLEGLVQGLHSGTIHRMLSKPLQRAELTSLIPPKSPSHASAAAH